jgi:hypothetical protein
MFIVSNGAIFQNERNEVRISSGRLSVRGNLFLIGFLKRIKEFEISVLCILY